MEAQLCENILFKNAVNHVLANYRSTLNCTSDCTPAVLIFGREMTMPLKVLLPVVVEKTKHNNELLQKAQKHRSYYDRRHRCKESVFMVGDHVKIREFRHQHNLLLDFTNNVFVVLVEWLVGKNADRLTDGCLWNLNDCLYVNTPVVDREENTVDEFNEPQLVDLSLGLNDDIPIHAREASQVALRRSQRVRKPRISFSPYKGRKCSVCARLHVVFTVT